jgi:hypothetical protein
MQEKKRQKLAQPSDSSGNDFFDAPGDGVGGPVEVTHGAYTERLPAGEMTVAQLRARFADRLDIHPQATALIDGNAAGDDTRVHTGQVVMFVRPSGEKGWI